MVKLAKMARRAIFMREVIMKSKLYGFDQKKSF